jgi:uncharacterized protein YbaP (TraB family)
VRRLLAALLALAPAQAALADAPPPDWSSSIETVVVTPNQGGPLMWRVSKGDASVILLGLVDPVPEGLSWNTTGVGEALKGARQLLLNAQASVGLVEGLWYLTWHGDTVYLPDDTPFESTLPEALRRRFVAARENIHRDEDRYSSLRPPLAALRLEGDYFDSASLSRTEPQRTIERMARRMGVSAKPVAEYEALPMLRVLPSLSKAANEACVKDALDDLDALRAHAALGAEAWAAGDLDGIKANYSEERFQSCIQAVPAAAALFVRAVRDSVAAANAALAQHGKTVMIVSIGALLRKDGILDKLKAEGLQVEGP